jgi:hypothetical protein
MYLCRVKTLLTLLLFCAAFPLCAQLRTLSKTDETRYASGTLKTRTTTYTTTHRRPDPGSPYKKEKIIRTSYDSAGRKTEDYKLVRQFTREGRPCRDLRLKQTNYSEGKRIRKEKSRCDGRRSVVREYANGRCISKCVNRRPKRS